MILVINKPLKHARNLSDMFYYMGILSYAATPSEALSEISEIYQAVIIMSPDTLPDKRDYLTRLRGYANVPIFAMTDSPTEEDILIFDGILKRSGYAASIIDKLNGYAKENGIAPIGEYRLAGIDASAFLSSPTYFDKAIPFTKTESMILRALIVTYPTPSEAKDILKYAFKPSKAPELSNVRTHISIMNKKYREIAERKIITLAVGEGYRILTPEFSDFSDFSDTLITV